MINEFHNREDIQQYVDRVCTIYEKPRLMVEMSRQIEDLGQCSLVKMTINDRLLRGRVPQINEDLHPSRSKFPELTLVQYVVLHELFHHISGLMDGDNFEHQVVKFIEKEINRKRETWQ